MRYPRAVGATPVRSWRASLADPGLGDQLVQPPARGRERLGVTPDLIPGITIALEPPGHLVDGPAVRAKALVHLECHRHMDHRGAGHRSTLLGGARALDGTFQ